MVVDDFGGSLRIRSGRGFTDQQIFRGENPLRGCGHTAEGDDGFLHRIADDAKPKSAAHCSNVEVFPFGNFIGTNKVVGSGQGDGQCSDEFIGSANGLPVTGDATDHGDVAFTLCAGQVNGSSVGE